jgi:hypothetical protein
MKNFLKKLFFVSVMLPTTLLCGITPTNFFVPYDSNLRPPFAPDTKFRLGAAVEFGNTKTGQNWDSKKKNILKLYDEQQDLLYALQSPVTAPVSEIAPEVVDFLIYAHGGIPGVINPAAPESRLGLVGFEGRFHDIDTTLYGSYKFPFKILSGGLKIGAYLPIRYVKIDGVEYTDFSPTQHLSDADEYFAERYTKKFDLVKTYAKNFGNLDLGSSWSAIGFGDLIIMLDWIKCFKQDKEFLKKVILWIHGGISVPTGKKKNEDIVLSMPLGNNGAWGLPFGLGLKLGLGSMLRVGVDADFLFLLDDTRLRRLKTNEHQTEMFLFNKGSATLEHGLLWKFNLFIEGFHLLDGLSLKINYQYTKHDEDKLSLRDNNFSYDIVNTANSLKEWNSHNVIFMANYDFLESKDKFPVAPQIGLFYKLPVGGKGVINMHSFGGQVSINF